MDTVDFGRLLILDQVPNLAESDTDVYTRTLMNLPGQEDYGDKEVKVKQSVGAF